MSRVRLKQIVVACAVVLMWGCASRGVRCSGQLEPINAAVAGAEATAEQATPDVAEAPNEAEVSDD